MRPPWRGAASARGGGGKLTYKTQRSLCGERKNIEGMGRREGPNDIHGQGMCCHPGAAATSQGMPGDVAAAGLFHFIFCFTQFGITDYPVTLRAPRASTPSTGDARSSLRPSSREHQRESKEGPGAKDLQTGH